MPTTDARTGRKIIWPVATLEASRPTTRPRRAVNQRVATVALSTMAVQPLPMPTNTPQVSMSCHSSVMKVLSATVALSRPSANMTTGRIPKRCMAAAAKGPMKPKMKMLIPIAAEMLARVHPNSPSRGTIRTPGVARTPAPVMRTRKTSATTIQAK